MGVGSFAVSTAVARVAEKHSSGHKHEVALWSELVYIAGLPKADAA